MGIVPSSGYRVGCSFFQVGRPHGMPDIKGNGKITLIGVTQSCGDLFEFNARL
jgi:hypothetical protein